MAMPEAVKTYRDNARYWGEQAARSIQMIWNDGRDHDEKMAEAYAKGAYQDAMRAFHNARASLSVIPSMRERQGMELADLAKLLESVIAGDVRCYDVNVWRKGRVVIVKGEAAKVDAAYQLANAVSVPGTTWFPIGDGPDEGGRSFQVRF